MLLASNENCRRLAQRWIGAKSDAEADADADDDDGGGVGGHDHGDGDGGGADDGNGAVGWPTMDGCQILCPGDDEGLCLNSPN